MHIFTCNDFRGHWPVGTAAVVVAKDEKHARRLLIAAVRQAGLSEYNFTLEEVGLDKARAIILQDGNY